MNQTKNYSNKTASQYLCRTSCLRTRRGNGTVYFHLVVFFVLGGGSTNLIENQQVETSQSCPNAQEPHTKGSHGAMNRQ